VDSLLDGLGSTGGTIDDSEQTREVSASDIMTSAQPTPPPMPSGLIPAPGRDAPDPLADALPLDDSDAITADAWAEQSMLVAGDIDLEALATDERTEPSRPAVDFADPDGRTPLPLREREILADNPAAGSLEAPILALNAAGEPVDGPAAVQEHPAKTALLAEQRRRARVQAAIAAVAAVFVLLVIVAQQSYAERHESLTQLLAETRDSLADWNFASRVEASERLAGVHPTDDTFTQAGDWGARTLLGRGGLAEILGAIDALEARVLAERVWLFGERTLEGAARQAVQAARGSGLPDAHRAAAMLAIFRRSGETAREAIGRVDPAQDGIAQLLLGEVARLDGDDAAASAAYTASVGIDPGVLPAHTAAAQMLDRPQTLDAARAAFDSLLESTAPNHVDSRIAYFVHRVRAGDPDVGAEIDAYITKHDNVLGPGQRARLYLARGDAALRAEDSAAAKAAFEAAISRAQGDPRAALGSVRWQVHGFQLDDADAALGRLEKAPGIDDARALLRAEIALHRGMPEAALTALKALKRPTAPSRVLEGRAHHDLRQHDEAGRSFAEAAKLDPGLKDPRVWGLLTRLWQREDVIEGLFELRNPTAGERVLDRTLSMRAYAAALESDRRTVEARAELEAAAEFNPRDYRAHSALCRLSALREDAEEALEHCAAALEVNPFYRPAASRYAEVAEVWRNPKGVVRVLGGIVTAQGEPAEVRRLARAYVATDDLDKARALAEGAVTPATTQYVRGLVLSKEGQHDEAIAALASASKAEARTPDVVLGHAAALAAAGRYRDAAERFEDAERHGAGPEALLGAARAWLAVGGLEDALRAAQRAQVLARRTLSHPHVRADALYLRGRIQMRRGGTMRIRASRLFERALGINPHQIDALRALARVNALRDKPEEAIRWYRELVKLDEDDAEAHYRLGRLLHRDEATRADARGPLERAAELDKDGEWGERARARLETFK
jgi:tetratricopeptide (TPR) repeat protein